MNNNNNVILTNKTVKHIDPVLEYLPRLGLSGKKINRNGLIEGLKAGNNYVIPFTVTFTDYSTWTSTFKIKKMFKDEQKRDMIMVYEQKLGQFGIYFDSLRGGKFKNEFQVAWDDAVALQDTYKKELDEVQKDLNNQLEQVAFARKGNRERDIKINVLENEVKFVEAQRDIAQDERDYFKNQLVVVQNDMTELVDKLEDQEFADTMAEHVLLMIRVASEKNIPQHMWKDILARVITKDIDRLTK